MKADILGKGTNKTYRFEDNPFQLSLWFFDIVNVWKCIFVRASETDMSMFVVS